jgi:hypothetical protein
MTVLARARAFAAGAWTAASTPPVVLHELTHALLAQPWAERSGVVFDGADAALVVEWIDDPPVWGILLAHLGPLLIGLCAGSVGVWRLWVAPPTSTAGWLLTGCIAAWWLVFTMPSADDRNPQADAERDSDATTQPTTPADD